MQIKPIFVNVGYGEKTELQIGNRGSLTLEGDGIVDGFARSHLPEKGAITDIRDTRIEEFIQRPMGKTLGKDWEGYSYKSGDGYTFGANHGPYDTMQCITLDSSDHKVGLLTRSFDEKGEVEHWIFANYDPQTCHIQENTIQERIGGCNGTPSLFKVESGGQEPTMENQMRWSLWSGTELR